MPSNKKKPSLNQLNKKAALWYCEIEDLLWISYPETLYLKVNGLSLPYESESLLSEVIQWRESSYQKKDFLKMKDTFFICWI